MPSLPSPRRMWDHFGAVTEYNIQTLRRQPVTEISGALGDLGTLLPLMIAMALENTIDLSATLVFSGLTNMFTGMIYGIPLPVQPMKAIAAAAVAEGFSKEETAAAGLVVSVLVFVLSSLGVLRWLKTAAPIPVVKGIQIGAGLRLVIFAGGRLLLTLGWVSPPYDNRIWIMGAFIFLIICTLIPRVPYAFVLFTVGLVMTAAVTAADDAPNDFTAGLWKPAPFVPSGPAWLRGGVEGAIPQMPLTTLNSILSVASISSVLFPDFPPAPTTTSLGFSVSIANGIACWFGAMPICHGSGGFAAQYRFGARSGSSVFIIGTVKLLLGLFVGDGLIPLLKRYPKSFLGLLVLAAGIELAKVVQTVGGDHWEHDHENATDGEDDDKAPDEEGQEPVDALELKKAREEELNNRWMVMLVTVAGSLAFKNDAVGFVAGRVYSFGMTIPSLIQKRKKARAQARGAIRLPDSDAQAIEQGEGGEANLR